ncbi:immunoglobulin domain-containing protein [Nakamurella lactea]|uniref:immunoglobulin domain-containing protein n=1 Tax=Nakamurella lactea TaxID=459515 RepID=UPI0012B54073|nr:immunoglobulin domain-containing protein [Nakamurella lactea]
MLALAVTTALTVGGTTIAQAADPGAPAQSALTMAPTATLAAVTKPKVTTQPASKRVAVGKQVTFTVKATGYAVKYRWQQQLPGKSWTYVAGATKSYHNVTASAARNGSSYRVVLNNVAGQTVSAAAKLTVVIPKPVITSQPASKRVTAGAVASFAVKATGYAVTYRWQKLVGKTWTNISGAVHSTHNVRATSAQNGTQFRVVVRTGSGQVISKPVTLGVQSTRSDPYRVGLATSLKGWRVNLASSNPNAWASVKAQGFSPGPSSGNRYVVGEFNVRYLASGSSAAWWDLDVEFVGSNGRTYTDTDKFYWNNGIYSLNEMYRNATGSFYSVVEVPATAAAGGRWKITDHTDWQKPVVVWYAAN